jgi:UDP-sugar transporter A1/2/3
VAGIILFNFRITPSFVIGCSVVLAATYVYNKPAASPVRSPSVHATPDPAQVPFLAPNATPPHKRANGSAASIALNFDLPDAMSNRRPYDVATPPASADPGHLKFGSPSENPYTHNAHR